MNAKDSAEHPLRNHGLPSLDIVVLVSEHYAIDRETEDQNNELADVVSIMT